VPPPGTTKFDLKSCSFAVPKVLLNDQCRTRKKGARSDATKFALWQRKKSGAGPFAALSHLPIVWPSSAQGSCWLADGMETCIKDTNLLASLS